VTGLLIASLPGVVGAMEPVSIPTSDHIEAVQTRAWIKRGALTIGPEGSFAFNDPFLVRGGGGVRAVYWVRSLFGLSIDATGWGQAPSEDAIIAQRELRAQLRPTGSSWCALGGAEITPIDGKIAALGGILPFELQLRLAAGAASSRDAVTSSPALALSAGIGARWFLSPLVALDTTVTWRSASITRSLNGASVASRDTVVSFDLGVPLRVGGGP
jgi:hypothetical protein